MLSTLSRLLFLNNATSSSSDSIISATPTVDPENPPAHLDLTTGHVADAGKGLYFGPRFQLGNGAAKTEEGEARRKKKKKKSIQSGASDLGNGQVWQPIPTMNSSVLPEGGGGGGKKQPFSVLTIPFSIRNVQLECQETNNTEISNRLYSLKFEVDTLIACRVGCIWGFKNGDLFPSIDADVGNHPRGKHLAVELKGPEQSLQSKNLEFFVSQDWLELCLTQSPPASEKPTHSLILVLEANSADLPALAMIYELTKKVKKRDSTSTSDNTTSRDTTSRDTATDNTTADISKGDDKTIESYYELHLGVQRLKIGEKTFVLKDVYGQPTSRDTTTSTNLRESISSSVNGERGGNRDCVVCLCEPKTVLPLPCRHCCLCMDCAQVLKASGAQCPVCRQPFHSLIRVDYTTGGGEEVVVVE